MKAWLREPLLHFLVIGALLFALNRFVAGEEEGPKEIVVTEAQVQADTRTYGQRCHDALVAMMRAMLMSGELGQHRGLPVTVILTADITALDPALGAPQAGRTGGSLDVPISDVLRMARHAEVFWRPCSAMRSRWSCFTGGRVGSPRPGSG